MFRSFKFGIYESSTFDKRYSPSAPTGITLLKSGSGFKINLSITNEESQFVSMLDIEIGVYYDHKT